MADINDMMTDFTKGLIRDWFDQIIEDDRFWQDADGGVSFQESVRPSIPYVINEPAMEFCVERFGLDDYDFAIKWMSDNIGKNGVDWAFSKGHWYFADEDAAVLFKLTWL